MPILSRFNVGDIRIAHHFTGQRIILHSFRHRGYWYYGRARERETMELFPLLIARGDTVIEVGGHIGYITLYVASLVGDAGRVIVFEPGLNNLRYIEANIAQTPNIRLIKKAVGRENGEFPFFLENLTGQNNTLVPDYHLFQGNLALAQARESYQEVRVEVVRLDDFLDREQLAPDLLKIDVEGAELDVLRGMQDCLATHQPKLVIEITQDHKLVHELLEATSYVLFSPTRERIAEPTAYMGNAIALHREKHAVLIAQWHD